MAATTRGLKNDVKVDTSALARIADGTKKAGKQMGDAAAHARKARRFEGWSCREKDNVSLEISALYTEAERISKYLAAAATILEQGAAEFESTQSTIIPSLRETKLKGI